jgi:hypothetical protein
MTPSSQEEQPIAYRASIRDLAQRLKSHGFSWSFVRCPLYTCQPSLYVPGTVNLLKINNLLDFCATHSSLQARSQAPDAGSHGEEREKLRKMVTTG